MNNKQISSSTVCIVDEYYKRMKWKEILTSLKLERNATQLSATYKWIWNENNNKNIEIC